MLSIWQSRQGLECFVLGVNQRGANVGSSECSAVGELAIVYDRVVGRQIVDVERLRGVSEG
jgi:hypothetical protein